MKDNNIDNEVQHLLAKAKRSPMPKEIKPMLATLVDEPFDDPKWLYEVKWDGYRALSYVNKGSVDILSRNNKSFNDKYYPLRDLLSQWTINAVLDGEIIVLNEKGQSNFGHLQNWRSEADGELAFYVFDFLWYDGINLMDLPIESRRKVLEGIIAKRKDSTYIPDARTREWLKIKVNKRQEVVIGGFTKNEGSAKKFSSLLLGVYENNKLQYVG